MIEICQFKPPIANSCKIVTLVSLIKKKSFFLCKLGYAAELHALRIEWESWVKQRLHNWFYARPSAFHIGRKGPGKCQRWKSGQHSTPAELQSDHLLQPAWEMARAQGCFKMEMPSSPEIFVQLRASGLLLHVSGGNALRTPSSHCPELFLWDRAELAASLQPCQSRAGFSQQFGVWITRVPVAASPALAQLTHTRCLGAFAPLWLCHSVLGMPCYYSYRIQPFRGSFVLIILFI